MAAAQSNPSWTGGVTMYGAMSTFTCRQCGFIQWFAAAPSEISIGAEFRTALLDDRQ